MRPKVAFGILLLALLAMGGAVFLKRHSNALAPVPTPAITVSKPASLPPPSPIASDAPAPAPTPDEEIDRLREWGRNNDPQSLSNILADLTSPDKDVREAAIEAAKQFGSTNAIPALKAAAINSTDTDEQIEMLQAAQFLALPSIADIHLTPEQAQAVQTRSAQTRAQLQAQAQTQRQVHAQSQGQNAASSPASPSPQP